MIGEFNEAKGRFPVHLYDYHGNLLESVLVKQTNLVSIGEGISEVEILFPYDVPPLLPSVLMLARRHVRDAVPISTSAKATFASFWKSHQDNWAEFKTRFDRDDLDDLMSILVSANYYA